MAKYYHSILKLRETEVLRNTMIRSLDWADSRTSHDLQLFTSHRSTVVGHGTEPRELLLTTISSNTELNDHKIVCELVPALCIKLAAYTRLCLYECMRSPASSKPRKRVCAYEKMCGSTVLCMPHTVQYDLM